MTQPRFTRGEGWSKDDKGENRKQTTVRPLLNTINRQRHHREIEIERESEGGIELQINGLERQRLGRDTNETIVPHYSYNANYKRITQVEINSLDLSALVSPQRK